MIILISYSTFLIDNDLCFSSIVRQNDQRQQNFKESKQITLTCVMDLYYEFVEVFK